MDILEVIKSRRSIRRYKKDSPSDEAIERILEAGRWAPSGLNNQPWRFLVIKDKDRKDKLATFTKYGYIIKDAPVVIVVCLDKESSYHREKDLMAIGACIQNMLLEAHSLGMGSCWLGEILNRKQAVERYLNLKGNLELTAVISLGYPDEKAHLGKRKTLKALKIQL